MHVPIGREVEINMTANDVIHAFAVPAFWTKIDANPGMINETWAKVDRPGVYFGQCYELCGARHAYMPIAVEAVPPAQFAAWVASKGGTMPVLSGRPGRPAEGPGTKPAAAPPPAPAAAGAPQGGGTPPAAQPAAPTPGAANRATSN